MPQVEDIKVLNIDNVPYAVDGMSDEVKAMVDVFNGWSRKEAEALDELTLVRAAKNDLSRQIILQVRKEKEEAEAAEAGEEVTDAPEAEASVDGE